MNNEDFMKLIQDVLSRCNNMIKASPGLDISYDANDVILNTFSFAETQYYLTIHSESNNILLYRLADVVVERVNQIKDELSVPGSHYFLKNWPLPNDAERIAQDFCSDMRNRLVTDFRLTYGLDFALIDDLSSRPYEKAVVAENSYLSPIQMQKLMTASQLHFSQKMGLHCLARI